MIPWLICTHSYHAASLLLGIATSCEQVYDHTEPYIHSINYINKINNDLRDKNNKDTHRLIHNLITLNAHNIQEIYSIIPQGEISKESGDKIKFVCSAIEKDPIEAAKTLLRIAKNNAAMKTEFSVFNKLFGKPKELRSTSHTMHKVLMNILYLFFPDFTDKGVKVIVNRDNASAYFDYESIHVALYHLIDNAAKYTRNNSELSINIKTVEPYVILVFQMKSIKILPNEVEKIYEEGFSGSLSQGLLKSGNGIGMNLVKRILELNHGSVSHISQPNTCEKWCGIEYQVNEFIIQLPMHKHSVQ